MNAPAKIQSHWSDERTKRAFALLEDLLRELDPESDAASMVFHAMEAVEAADCEVA